MTIIPRIVLTSGEPAGIGPDLIIQMAQLNWAAELVVVADPDLLLARAKLLHLPLQLIPCDLNAKPKPHLPGQLPILPVALKTPCVPGQLNKANSAYVLETLQLASTLCINNQASAMVTGPVHKAIINEAGVAFSGHTEFFANHAGVHHTVMLFVIDELKVALLTTHLPLSQVPAAITSGLLTRTLSILHQGLINSFGIVHPRIAVCGLNPHAGENGYLGREEIEVITPCLHQLRERGMQLYGPEPADTAFTAESIAKSDAILAMYHDQALPVIKARGFERAVNVTLGLPYIRTSPDHGTALTLAGTGRANAGSMQRAIALSLKLCRPTLTLADDLAPPSLSD